MKYDRERLVAGDLREEGMRTGGCWAQKKGDAEASPRVSVGCVAA